MKYRKSMMLKKENIDTVCSCVHSYTLTTDIMDSAFATASAQGQLKGVRPCQSIQEWWQTAQMCAYVCVWGFYGARWAVSWPKPQPDFINQGRKCAQPLTLGLKTLLTMLLPCLFLPFSALSACNATFSSVLSCHAANVGYVLSLCHSADKFSCRDQLAGQGFQNNTSSSRRSEQQ